MVVFNFLAIFVVFLAISEIYVAQGSISCPQEIQNFFECKEEARQHWRSNDWETTRKQINQCFTSNNCENPDTFWEEKERVHECLNRIKKSVKDDCEEEVNPGFTFPDPGRNRGHHWWWHHHHNRRRRHHGRWSSSGGRFLRKIERFCSRTNTDFETVQSCIDGVLPNPETIRSKHEEIYRAFRTCYAA